MKTKTQQKLDLKHIKIRLSGKETLQREILEKVGKQGIKQGLRYREFVKFENKLYATPKAKYLDLTKNIFNVAIR